MKYAEKLMEEMVEGGCDEVTLNDPAGNWWKLTLTEELNCRIKPKEKKKLYLWAFKLPDDTEWGFDDNLHASEEDVRNSWPDNNEQVSKVIFKRIDNSMIEVDA